MSISLYERIQTTFGFSPFTGFEDFFKEKKVNYKSSKLLTIPQDHELVQKIRSIQLVELESEGDFEKYIVLVENTQREKSAIYMCRDKFKPNNRSDFQGQETMSHAIYGNAATVGSIQIFKAKDKKFDEIKKIADEKAQKMTKALEQTGIKSLDVVNSIQLSGMYTVVLAGGYIGETVGYLFGVNGPFRNVLIIPEKMQSGLMRKIYHEGGKNLLNPDIKINISQFNHLMRILKGELKSHIKDLNEIDRLFLAKAFSAYIPYFTHLYNQAIHDNENFAPPKHGLIRYLERVLAGQIKASV